MTGTCIHWPSESRMLSPYIRSGMPPIEYAAHNIVVRPVLLRTLLATFSSGVQVQAHAAICRTRYACRTFRYASITHKLSQRVVGTHTSNDPSSASKMRALCRDHPLLVPVAAQLAVNAQEQGRLASRTCPSPSADMWNGLTNRLRRFASDARSVVHVRFTYLAMRPST